MWEAPFHFETGCGKERSVKIPFMALMMAVMAALSVPAQETAVIQELFGTVELKDPGSGWRAAFVGDRLEESSVISTGFKSAAVVALGDSTLFVYPLTRLSLRELGGSGGGGEAVLDLHTGRVRADLRPSPGHGVTLQAPAAAVSAQEASFDFDTVNLQVSAGAAALSGSANPGRSIRVGGGAETHVRAGRPQRVFGAARAELGPFRPAGSDFTGRFPIGSNAPLVPPPLAGAAGWPSP
jgi:hypothetical protein